MKSPTRHPRARKALIWSALGIALAFAGLKWGLPWLGRRGNLNSLIENALRSSLSIPVRIEKIDTEPFSELRVTHLKSVSAQAKDRFGFTAREIAIRYDPFELLSGRIRNALFETPEVFINLDAELSGLAKLPKAPAEIASLKRPASPANTETGDSFLPVTIDSATIEGGKITLRLNARELELTNLRLEVSGLGKSVGQSFILSVEALGGVVKCWGGVDVVRSPNSATRYTFQAGRVVISGLDASLLIAWLASDDVKSSWLGPILSKTRGKLALEGSLDGTWPEAVQLSLATHASDVFTAYDADLAVNDGSLGVHVNAKILGDLESVKFSLSTHGAAKLQAAGAADESMEIDIEGELRRRDGPGGVLEIAPSVAVLVETGEVRFSGRVDEILGDVPRLDLAVETPGLDATALISRIPPSLKTGFLGELAARKAGGELSSKARITGPVTRPRTDGSFEARNLNLPLAVGGDLTRELHGEWKALEVDSSTGASSIESLQIETGDVDVHRVAQALGAQPGSLDLRGLARVRLEASEQCFPIGSSGLRGTLSISTSDVDWALPSGRAGVSDLNGKLEALVSFHPKARKLLLSLQVDAGASEALAGSFYAGLAERRASAAVEAQVAWSRDWQLEGIQIAKSSCTLPFLGPVTATAQTFSSSDGGLTIDATINAIDIPGPEAFPVLVSEPLSQATSFFDGGKLDGRASLALRIEGKLSSPVYWGRLTLAPSRLALKSANLTGLELDVPFEFGDSEESTTRLEDSGFIGVEAVEAPGLAIASLRLPFRFARGSYSFEPASIKLFDGKVELKEAAISPRGKQGIEARVGLTARKLKLRKIAKTFDLPPMDGEGEVELAPITLVGARMESHGTVRLKTFGGEISFRDLSIDNVSKPYADLRLKEGRVDHLRLDKLGETFHFGLMSGVLDGTVADLSFTGDEISSFRLDVATVPTSGVPQYLNRAAIESIRRVFSGPLGAIEETFFSKFKFTDFGFACSLEDGIFKLHGKYPEGGKEYILRARWYQLPQVNIINGRPDQPYDWKTIITNLRRIYERK